VLPCRGQTWKTQLIGSIAVIGLITTAAPGNAGRLTLDCPSVNGSVNQRAPKFDYGKSSRRQSAMRQIGIAAIGRSNPVHKNRTVESSAFISCPFSSKKGDMYGRPRRFNTSRFNGKSIQRNTDSTEYRFKRIGILLNRLFVEPAFC
jgi:hypothetical protein